MSVSAAGSVRALAVVGAFVVLTACSDRQNAARADSDLSHDLALAGQTRAQPALKDAPLPGPVVQPKTVEAPQRTRQRAAAPQPTRVAATPPPQTPAPVPAPQPVVAAPVASAPAPAPAPVAKVVATGTAVSLTSGAKLCTTANKVGDKITATVSSTVTGAGGASIPAGSRVVVEVSQVRLGDTPENSTILLRATSVYIDGVSYPVSGDVASNTNLEKADAPNTGVSDTKKVLGGAAAGAILGQILGHNTKGTVIGAAAGAAAGAAVAHAQKSYQACLPEGASLRLTLASPLTLN